MYRRNRKHLLRIECDEDRTIEISDDEDEAEVVNVKSEDNRHVEEENVAPERKADVRTRSGRISRRPSRFEEYETF